MKKDELINKLKELLKEYENKLKFMFDYYSNLESKYRRIKSEIASLEGEIEQESNKDDELSIQDFKDKYGLVYDDIETAIRNYVNGKIEQEPKSTIERPEIQLPTEEEIIEKLRELWAEADDAPLYYEKIVAKWMLNEIIKRNR